MWQAGFYLPRSAALFLGLVSFLFCQQAARGEDARLAIGGYDTVAYFTEGKPVPGKSDFEYLWHNARWRFVSAAHRDLFKEHPGRYAPQYDGYCAMGVAFEAPHKDTVDPTAWAIVDGKLYLNHSRHLHQHWQQNAAKNIARADKNWSAVKQQAEPVVVGPPCPAHPPSVTVSFRDGGKRILVGAQTAVDNRGHLVGKGDMQAQVEQAGRNVQACLRAVGADASQLLQTTAYVTDPAAFSRTRAAQARYFGPQSAIKVVKVPRLAAGPDFMVEIEAIASVR